MLAKCQMMQFSNGNEWNRSSNSSMKAALRLLSRWISFGKINFSKKNNCLANEFWTLCFRAMWRLMPYHIISSSSDIFFHRNSEKLYVWNNDTPTNQKNNKNIKLCLATSVILHSSKSHWNEEIYMDHFYMPRQSWLFCLNCIHHIVWIQIKFKWEKNVKFKCETRDGPKRAGLHIHMKT